jgi:hypothetical protein
MNNKSETFVKTRVMQVRQERDVPDAVNTLDIRQLLLNDKIKEGSRDNSPVISTKRQISVSSTDEISNYD